MEITLCSGSRSASKLCDALPSFQLKRSKVGPAALQHSHGCLTAYFWHHRGGANAWFGCRYVPRRLQSSLADVESSTGGSAFVMSGEDLEQVL